MSEHASNRAGRDYDIPIVWHEPAEFDMAGCAETQNGGFPKSPSGSPSQVKKKPKATKRRRKR